ncbi:hypothetical protein BAU15_02640 [Enterococcus sp. JM4C]|uniref:hypothetical protein n=1 Tax=Candidatus Enterococcus huntleyi TaxID=1857217 RepID=UPI001379F08D|nr:hypothetical protein [Enterococcus sp. JM4C]KAF1299559.1 hypothetical protein BAU15_02640 [Enterococcus sp. JM4C]
MEDVTSKKKNTEESMGQLVYEFKNGRVLSIILGLPLFLYSCFMVHQYLTEDIIYIRLYTGAEVSPVIVMGSAAISMVVGGFLLVNAFLTKAIIKLYDRALIVKGKTIFYEELENITIRRASVIHLSIQTKDETIKLKLMGLKPKEEQMLLELLP